MTENSTEDTDNTTGHAGRAARELRPTRPSAMEVLRTARSQFTELTGLDIESVSAFEPADDGWNVTVEVLELARIPDTVSLLATYQVRLDDSGQLAGYRRVRRYERGRADRG